MKNGLQFLIAGLTVITALILGLSNAYAAEAANTSSTEARGNVSCPDGKCYEGSPVADGPNVGKGYPEVACGSPLNGLSAEQNADVQSRHCPAKVKTTSGKGSGSGTGSAPATSNK